VGASVHGTKRELQAARSSTARIEQQTQLVALLNERITQSKLLTPAEDMPSITGSSSRPPIRTTHSCRPCWRRSEAD
jgi:hypothetical protein